MSRTTTRIILASAIFISIILTAVALKSAIEGKDAAWAVVAASLAVITSVVSSWNAQRVVELEEDRQRPYPYPYLDLKSRYGFALLSLTNFGQSAAHNIKINFDKEIINKRGEAITFKSKDDGSDIPILLPQQNISIYVGSHVELFDKNKELKFTGKVIFENASGKEMEHSFVIGAEMYEDTPLYEKEDLRTHFELQKIPKAIEDLNRTLKKKSNNIHLK